MIEYDRQVIGGSAAIYISFDGRASASCRARASSPGLKALGTYSKKPVVAELHGGQTDNNSFLFKGGYESILNPLYKNGTLKKGPQQFTPGWDNQKAGTIFEQMLVKTSNKIHGVAAANDGLANAVVVALKARKLKPIALSGQDATAQGVQNIISGWQTMTVWKDTRKLATASAAAAIALAKGEKPKQTGTVANGSKRLPAFIIPPVSITKTNYKQLFNGYLKRSKVCRRRRTRSSASRNAIRWGPSAGVPPPSSPSDDDAASAIDAPARAATGSRRASARCRRSPTSTSRSGPAR